MSSSALSLLWWVVIGLLFFWIMSRGGCGGMMRSRGRERESGRTNGHAARSASGKPVDPVCGMEVEPAAAAGTRVAAGVTYFFCSETCLAAFDKDPAMYAQHHEVRPEERPHQHAGC